VITLVTQCSLCSSMFFLLPLFLLFLPSSSLTLFPVISTSFGFIRGYPFTSSGGFTAHIFKKLPFAAAPLGDLRWAKPQPPPKWNETIDGTFFGPACAQRNLRYSGPVTGVSEDCLHINVYTSERCTKGNSSCPVLFLIHGGSATYESTMKFPDETLVDNFVSQDIVVVSTAYRLGPFGVMALGDENALPANLAMHDVLAALHFVRAEIHAFGGDKERITLMGQSTGASIALFFAFSPAISPPGVPRLFSGVASMSGTIALETMERQVERSHSLATLLNCSGTAWEITACLRKKTTDQVLSAQFTLQGGEPLKDTGVIGLVMGGELFPIYSAKDLRENAQPLRMMAGTTFYEIPSVDEVAITDKSRVNKVIGFENDEECVRKYEEDIQSGEFKTIHSVESQEMFMTTQSLSKAEAENGGEVYLYSYDYLKHAKHTDDAFFVLGFHEYDTDENEDWLSRVFPRYFANFIKGGRPAPDWYQLKPHLMNYYSVNRNESSGVSPHMKFGYQQELADYYEKMEEYDQRLSALKREILNAPIEYH
ncbi:hypothetical protein PMAYCL1PPCAC_02546, partial [Pristionchus mayeri]